MKKVIICTVCPTGCEIEVIGEVIGKDVKIDSMTGFGCKRGKEFATDEFILPMRIFTSTVKLEDSDELLLPVRSDALVPKDKLFECMKIIRETTIKAPVNRGDILIPNILNLNCNIIASRSDGKKSHKQ